MLIDLGDSWLELHQATISPCGRYYMLALGVGPNHATGPAQSLLTIDLVTKKIINTIHAKHTQTEITVLNAMACKPQ